MVSSMPLFGDIQTNMRFDGGIVRCHSTTDAELTSSGDLALVPESAFGLRQRLLIWLAVPRGELFDPEAGCPVYDYFHTRLTGSDTQALANDMKNSFRYLFPELNVQKVEISRTDYTTLFMEIYAGSSKLGFLFSQKDCDLINKNMWGAWADNHLVPFPEQQEGI